MKIIGITGGIGSGKTTVSDYLRREHYRVIDADRISHEIMEPGSDLVNQLGAAFGQDLINEEGVLNRRELANRAFSSKEGKHILEEITHREIMNRIRDAIAKADLEALEIVFIDVVLLFEVGLDKICTETWLVDASEDIRLARVIGRDGYIPDEIRKRMRSQMPSEEKRARATYILDNEGTVEELYNQIDELLQNN